MSDPVAFLRARLAERLEIAEIEQSMVARFVPDGHEVTYMWARMVTNREAAAAASVLYSPGCPSPADVVDDVRVLGSILDAWDDANCGSGAEASYAWVLIRDVVIRPWLRRSAEHPEFDPAWLR